MATASTTSKYQRNQRKLGSKVKGLPSGPPSAEIAMSVCWAAKIISGTSVTRPSSRGTAMRKVRLRAVSGRPFRPSSRARKKPDIAKKRGSRKRWTTQKITVAQAPSWPLTAVKPAAWTGTSSSIVDARRASIEWIRAPDCSFIGGGYSRPAGEEGRRSEGERARYLGEAGTRLVALGEEWLGAGGDRPLAPHVGVVPGDPRLGRGVVEAGELVRDVGFLAEDEKAVAEAGGDEELAVGPVVEDVPLPLPIAGRAAAQADGDLEGLPPRPTRCPTGSSKPSPSSLVGSRSGITPAPCRTASRSTRGTRRSGSPPTTPRSRGTTPPCARGHRQTAPAPPTSAHRGSFRSPASRDWPRPEAPSLTC